MLTVLSSVIVHNIRSEVCTIKEDFFLIQLISGLTIGFWICRLVTYSAKLTCSVAGNNTCFEIMIY